MTRTPFRRYRTLVAVAVIATVAITTAPPASSEASIPDAPDASAPAAPPVAWAPCGAEKPGFDCATYPVPMDYTDPDAGTLELALTRLPATDTRNRIGSLFVNPGGPGGSGIEFAQGAGELLGTLTQGRFDIVGFDPRGVGASTPVQCFTSAAEAVLSGRSLTYADVVPDSRDEFVDAVANTAAYTATCGRRNADLLPYVSTEFVARDLDRLRAAVGDEQLTYYGLSYGTVLGQTYANIFPDQVRAVALDGVVDPRAYTADVTSFWQSNVADAEETLDGFFRTCEEAGPAACALAGRNPERIFRQVLSTLRREGPLPAVGSAIPGTVEYDEVVLMMYNALYDPVVWPAVAAALHQASTGDGSGLRDAVLSIADVPAPAELATAPYDNSYDAALATLCNDTGVDGNAQQWPRNAARTARVSRLFGPPNVWALGLPCATWPAQAVSRYSGPWDAHTANPVLLIGTRFDPASPLASAELVNRLLPDSRLLVHDGYGHTSLAGGQQSTCTVTALGAYLVGQLLPAEGTVCRPDRTPFSPEP